eukprot:5782025-Amphidinium_carterae.2
MQEYQSSPNHPIWQNAKRRKEGWRGRRQKVCINSRTVLTRTGHPVHIRFTHTGLVEPQCENIRAHQGEAQPKHSHNCEQKSPNIAKHAICVRFAMQANS